MCRLHEHINHLENELPTEITDRMREALKLIKRGKSPQQAADLAGVKRQSIYASRAYKKLIADRALAAGTRTGE